MDSLLILFSEVRHNLSNCSLCKCIWCINIMLFGHEFAENRWRKHVLKFSIITLLKLSAWLHGLINNKFEF